MKELTPKTDLKNQRPLSTRDKLAQGFPIDQFGHNELFGKLLFLVGKGWRYEKDFRLDKKAHEKHSSEDWRGWSPRILEHEKRWLLEFSESADLRFGIDSLKLGLNASLSLGEIVVFPYIHFGQPEKIVSPVSDELSKYGVGAVSLVMMHDWQVNELHSVIKDIA